MSVLIENPVAIAVVGGLLATIALVVFLAKRTTGALAALVGILAVTLLLLAVERFVVTDHEAVEYALDDMLAEVEANNVAGVLEWIDASAAGVRSDVEALMPTVKVDKARTLGDVAVEVNAAANPPTATSRFKAYLDGLHGSSGMRLAYFNQRVDIKWVKRGDQWLISGYTAYYDDQPIDAVSSARGNRAVPTR